MADLGVDELRTYIGRKLFDRNGELIGRVEDVYLNEANGQPEWLRVAVGPLGIRSTLVPVDRLDFGGADLSVSHDKAFVQAAPVYPEQYGALPPADEAQLFSYYGLPAGQFVRPHAAVPSRAR